MTPEIQRQVERFYEATAMTAIDLGLELMRCTHPPAAVALLIKKDGSGCSLFLSCIDCLAKGLMPTPPEKKTNV